MNNLYACFQEDLAVINKKGKVVLQDKTSILKCQNGSGGAFKTFLNYKLSNHLTMNNLTVNFIEEHNHKYIHFVDLQNKMVSIADPYCIGLLKLHHTQKKRYFYDIDTKIDMKKKESGPSILNRFSFVSENVKNMGNYSLEINNQQVDVASIDERYLNYYNRDIYNKAYENFRVIKC